MNVDGHSQVTVHHGGALGVPAGAAGTPRRGPAGLAGLRGLPQSKVERIALDLVLLDARAHHEVVHAATGNLAVGRVAAHGKVHIAVLGRVGMSLLDQALNHADHGADLLSGAGTHIRVEHVGAAHDGDELIRELLGHALGRTPLLVRTVDDLVVHVGEVLRKGHLVAGGHEPAANDVEADKRARVADVDVVVDRGTAHVHADLSLLDGGELGLLMRLGAVYLHGGNSSRASKSNPVYAVSLHRFSSRQTAQAPMPSPVPSQPRRSVVVAATPTFSTSTPRARARFSRIASRCGVILGS